MVVLSKTQKEILKYLTKDFLTVQQIAKRRQTSRQAVYKIIRKLKEKGLISRGFTFKGVDKQKGFTKKNKIRLHNIQETIKILDKSKFYLNYIKKKSNKLETKEFTAMLTENYVNVYTTEYNSFYGDTVEQCYIKAIKFFRKAYIKIENRLRITIDKEGYLNKRWVRQHIAETNNEIAAKANADKERIVVHDDEDGKEAIITDNSFNLNELECIHPTKAKEDAKLVIEKHIKAMRKEGSLDVIELTNLIKSTLLIQKEQAAGTLNNTLTLTAVLKLLEAATPKPAATKTTEKTIRPSYIG